MEGFTAPHGELLQTLGSPGSLLGCNLVQWCYINLVNASKPTWWYTPCQIHTFPTLKGQSCQDDLLLVKVWIYESQLTRASSRSPAHFSRVRRRKTFLPSRYVGALTLDIFSNQGSHFTKTWIFFMHESWYMSQKYTVNAYIYSCFSNFFWHSLQIWGHLWNMLADNLKFGVTNINRGAKQYLVSCQ